MKALIVLIVLAAAGYYLYSRPQEEDEPAVIESPVYAEFRVDFRQGGREANLVLFGEMTSEEDCRERADEQWQDFLASCKECVAHAPTCSADLDPRYRRLFDDAVISSTYLSFKRGSRGERNGRLVIYGLTADEGDEVCEKLRVKAQKEYTGTVSCVPARRG